jgi:hypothetical protein
VVPHAHVGYFEAFSDLFQCNPSLKAGKRCPKTKMDARISAWVAVQCALEKEVVGDKKEVLILSSNMLFLSHLCLKSCTLGRRLG